ncbi:MAG: hypothetical protein LBU04_06625 [Christensenellaceae bacterium]|jgi:hypothetical protein|nr:hypothetical protein [Christensenellaceae bacterium]
MIKMSKNIFNGNAIRTQYDAERKEWYFSAVDIVAVLADPSIPRNYWSDLKRTMKKEGSQLHEKIVQLKMVSPNDGKPYFTDTLDEYWSTIVAKRIRRSRYRSAFIEWLEQFKSGGNE